MIHLTSMGETWDGLVDERFCRAWTDIYEKEFQKFFHIPQLGLTREYQEKMNLMMDSFHLFQASHAEFTHLLLLPFQRAMAMMQEEVTVMAENGELPKDSKAYYRMWIKALEGHFMTLFQTPEYVEALSKTVGALTRFSSAKDAVLEDFIQTLPIARQSELDDLAKEVYELKRQIRQMRKVNHDQIQAS